MALTPLELLALGGASVVGGATNALAGGGTLLTFPMLVALGVPALSANLTNTVALLPGYVGGGLGQRRDLEDQGGRVAVTVVPAAVGGLIGALLLLHTDASIFRSLVPWLVLGATVLFALGPRVSRAVTRRSVDRWDGEATGTAGGDGSKARAHDGRRTIVLAAMALAGSIYGGYFGAGLGVVLLALFSLVVVDSLARINALKLVTSLAANGSAALLFAFSGRVVWSAALVMAVGSLLGGNLGGRFASRIPAVWLRRVVVALGLVISVIFFVR